MKNRLFWKIFFGFWITFVVTTEILWLQFNAAHPIVDYEKTIRRIHLSTTSVALQYGGKVAADQVVSNWLDRDQGSFRVQPLWPGPVAPPPPGASSIVVHDPQGRPWRLVDSWHAYTKPHSIMLNTNELEFAILGGLAFSAVLALYLTTPIRKLRDGFARLAEGNLTVRLGGQMGARRDELADLASDFDLMAERLQQLVISRDQLLHDVSHELRSPLARLQMAIGLARQNPNRMTASLERIERESRRLDELVGELLTLARGKDDAPPADQYFDFAELLHTVADDAAFEAQQAGVTVEYLSAGLDEAACQAPPMKGNAELLRRGLDNVVRNAIRYSPSGQVVSINSALDSAGYCVVVTDRGPGVPDHALDTIFEPFVRLQGYSVGQGYGLGLAIARRAVLAHGGAIAASNNAGGGLSIRLLIPAEDGLGGSLGAKLAAE